MRIPRFHRTAPALLATALTLALAACGGTAEPTPDAAATPTPAETEAAAPPADAAPQPGMPGAADPADPVAGGNPMLTQLAGLGGAMHAAVESCEPTHDPAQLADAKEQQRQNFEQMGGDATTFETEFTSAYDKVRAQFEGATAPQQQQMCDELAQMAAQPPAG
ncbi:MULTISPECIES: hypothetical protein [Luteimonas]|uniref:hypothetical protein n=1 Tax=Luteimonas TaxID=83614 RepID=UPI000C7E7729|nr:MULTISPECIES: hypothetical protein [Luteimonas]